MNSNLEQARATLNEFKPMLDSYSGKRSKNYREGGDKESGNFELNSALPDIEGPDAVCQTLVGSGRPSSAVVIAANAVYFAAKVLDIALNRGCNQVVVAGVIILGEGGVGGGNTSLACIISDGISFAAEQVRDKVASCDDDFTKRSVDVAVKRMETIHTDLESSVANDNANKNTIIANDNTNKGLIIANDNANLLTIKGAIDTGTTTVTTAVGDGTRTIVNNDNANTLALTNLINATRVEILNTVKDSKEETNNLLLRTQIEADLASTDGSTFVALYATPGNVCLPSLNQKGLPQIGALSNPVQCGLLDLVRSIVRDTIASVNTNSNASSFFAQGDAQRAGGDYKAAYASYRKAYKAAAK